jgi:hypothetical protein
VIRRAFPALVFALLGFVSLVVAVQVTTWLCSHILDNCIQAAAPCPIDVCEPDTRQYIIRIAVYFGPAIVFGGSAFLFSHRPRRIHAWLLLLAALVAVHVLVMTAATLA